MATEVKCQSSPMKANGNGHTNYYLENNNPHYRHHHEKAEKEMEIEEKEEKEVEVIEEGPSSKPYRIQPVWRNIIIMAILHGLFIYGVTIVPYAKPQTIVLVWLLGILSTLGVQAGAHRLWSHRAYKANFGLRLFLAACETLALQNDIYEWCRDHRGHHKWSETDADPHNSARGFFFSHMGWLLVKKHPEVIRRGRTVDLSDLEADPIVMFQRRFYIPLVLLFWGIIPTLLAHYLCGETLWHGFLACVCIRYILTLHLTWLVNSWAHLWGQRPYDAKIGPVEASIRDLLMGEGFHNYHHTFPWDYSASELGAWDVFNPCTAAINFFHYMGWAWDLKKVPESVVAKKAEKCGRDEDKGHFQRIPLGWKEQVRGLFSFTSHLMIFLAIHYLFRKRVAQPGEY